MKNIILITLGLLLGFIFFVLYDTSLFHLMPKMYNYLYHLHINKKIILDTSVDNKIIFCHIDNKQTVLFKNKEVYVYKQNCKDKNEH